ncbi:MAG: glycosyl hydrolase [Solirubrobacterales bacterium]
MTAEGRSVALGAYFGSASHPRRLGHYTRLIGRPPAIVGSYVQWRLAPFQRQRLARIWESGALPLVTWEPWTSAARPFPLRQIAAGRYDAYVHRAARAAARWGQPILLRFAQEMNGGWYPWGREHVGAHAYKAAWRHLVRVFRAEGARNVRWVWTPYVNSDGRFPFKGLYPGDRWVDWVGLDGFNWGTARGKWQWFGQVFGSSYRILARISSRPMIIAETGSSEAGGSKPRWVRRALRWEIPRMDRIRALVWFDEPFNGIDVRVNSSAASLRALRWAMRAPTYRSGRDAVIRATAHLHF